MISLEGLIVEVRQHSEAKHLHAPREEILRYRFQ